MNGNAKALDTVVKSEKFNRNYTCYKVNLSNKLTGKTGTFSFVKIKVLFEAIFKIRKIQKINKIDIYYLTNAQSLFGVIRDAIIIRHIRFYDKNAKIVTHLHGGGFKNFFNNSNGLIKKLVISTYHHVEKVIVLSPRLKSMYEGVVPFSKINVVNNCVDDEFFFEESIIREKINTISEKEILVVTYLSNMVESKGYKLLLEAAIGLSQFRGHLKIKFAGKFPDETSIEWFYEFIRKNTLEDMVEWVGIVSGEDKVNLLYSSDIFVLPTRYPQEGQPISMIEAMAAAMPVISTDQGGILDVIEDDINGFILKNRTSDEIANSIIRLYNDRKLLSKIAGNNYRKVQEQFREANYIDSLISVLQEEAE